MLSDCVTEVTPGDRLRTVDQLKDALAEHGGVSDEPEEDSEAGYYQDEGEDVEKQKVGIIKKNLKQTKVKPGKILNGGVNVKNLISLSRNTAERRRVF